MFRGNNRILGFPFALIAVGLMVLIFPAGNARAEILNDDEFGSLEILDMSVIEEAAGMYTPVGLSMNLSRGGGFRAGDEIYLYCHGQNDKYMSIIDFTPDRKVKPLVINELTAFGQGELDRTWHGVINEPLGHEYILMIISNLPLTDANLEDIALAPNEIEIGDLIVSVAINDFYVIAGGRDPNEVVDWGENNPGINFMNMDSVTGYTGHEPIPLSEMGEQLEYPSWIHPHKLWTRVHGYRYPWLVPTAYIDDYGIFSNVYYTVPVGVDIRSNFWNYASSGWIDNGIWIIPPGGYWSADFSVGDNYYNYYMRILPYLIRETTNYSHLGISINGVPVGNPVFDIRDAIGWGLYWDENPFMYYTLGSYLKSGVNTITLYWPSEESENLELQMMDVLPDTVLTGVAEP